MLQKKCVNIHTVSMYQHSVISHSSCHERYRGFLNFSQWYKYFNNYINRKQGENTKSEEGTVHIHLILTRVRVNYCCLVEAMSIAYAKCVFLPLNTWQTKSLGGPRGSVVVNALRY
jgi:hypothetical protein